MGAQNFKIKLRGRYHIKLGDFIAGTTGAIVDLLDKDYRSITPLYNEADTSGTEFFIGGSDITVVYQGHIFLTRISDDETMMFQEVQREINRDLNMRGVVQNTAPILGSYDSGTQRIKVQAG